MNYNKYIVDLYQKGLTIREIANKEKTTNSFIKGILLTENIELKRKFIKDFSEKNVLDIIELFKNGITIKNIAKQYNISAPAISKLLEKNKIKVISSLHKYDNLRKIPLNDFQKQVLTGTLLGNGYLSRHSENGMFKFAFSHCEEQMEYFNFKKEIFYPFITHCSRNVDKRGNSVILGASTMIHPGFNDFAKIFYQDNKKIIGENIEKYLTAISLAIWIQDSSNLNENVNIRISSMSFGEGGNNKLKELLFNIFNLDCKVARNGKYYFLWINKTNSQILSDIVRPYIVKSMKHKLMQEKIK